MTVKKTNPVKPQPADTVLQIMYKGHQYTIARENVDDVEIFELIEDGKSLSALRAMVGPVQWARFKDDARNDQGRVTMTEMNDFLNLCMEAIGGAQGNSSAS